MRHQRAGRRFGAVVAAIGVTLWFQSAANAWAQDAVIIEPGCAVDRVGKRADAQHHRARWREALGHA
jgi:hypothetical protein